MQISLEELERDILIKTPLNHFGKTNNDIQIDSLNNFINFRKKQREIFIENCSTAEEAEEVDENNQSKNKKLNIFNQVRQNEYSLYLTLDHFMMLIFGYDESVTYWKNFLDFRNIIYDKYVKTKSQTILHFTPFIPYDMFFLDVGIIEGIFNTLKDNKIKIIGYISNGNCNLTSLYLLSAYCDEIIAYPGISSVKLEVYRGYGKNTIATVDNFYLKRLMIIKERGILLDSEVDEIMANDSFILSINNETLLKRLDIK